MSALHLDGDQIICECGNTPNGAGWETCDTHGNAQEPLAESDWNLTYCCNDCGLIAQASEDWTTITKIGMTND